MAQRVRSVQALRQPSHPVVGEEVAGHGMFRRIAALPGLQPLASDSIWRVALEGETVIRVVRLRAARNGPRWGLLAMGDMTEEQLDTYEAAISGFQEAHSDPGPTLGF